MGKIVCIPEMYL